MNTRPPYLIVRHQAVPAVNLSPIKGEPIREEIASIGQAKQEDRMGLIGAAVLILLGYVLGVLTWGLW